MEQVQSQTHNKTDALTKALANSYAFSWLILLLCNKRRNPLLFLLFFFFFFSPILDDLVGKSYSSVFSICKGTTMNKENDRWQEK